MVGFVCVLFVNGFLFINYCLFGVMAPLILSFLVFFGAVSHLSPS